MIPYVRLCCLGVAILLVSACSSPESRIQEHQATFASLSPQEQERIRKGDVDIGYSPEMVTMALGEPDRRYTRTSSQGTSEVWAYRSKAPAISIGFGVGSGGHSSGVGAGLGVSTGGDRADDRMRVIFENGRVSAVERSGGARR